MNDISLPPPHRNDSFYSTNLYEKFANYHCYSSLENPNPSFYMHEPTATNHNVYHESSASRTIDVSPSHEMTNTNDSQSQEKQVDRVQPSGRRRRRRTVFSQSHIQQLDHVFLQNQYPDIDLRETLAAQMGVAESRIQVWFKNRRNRARTTQRRRQQRFQ